MIRIVSLACLAAALSSLTSACVTSSTDSSEPAGSESWTAVPSDSADSALLNPDVSDVARQEPDGATPDAIGAPDAAMPDTEVDTAGEADAELEVIEPPDSIESDSISEDGGSVEPWSDPGMVGPFTVNEHAVTASGEGDSFGAELYVPEGPQLARAVLLLPGFMLDASDFSSTSERLASHGFIVLCPSFGDSFLSAIDHADLAAHASAMLDWLVTQNELASGPMSGRLDPSGFGLSGHSRGGKVALLTGINDPRVEAIYTLDPVDTVGGPFSSTPTAENPSVTPELMGDLLIPAGFMGAGKGGDGFQPCAPEAENHQAYYAEANAAPIAYHHVDSGAGHMDFIDSGAAGLCAGGESSAETLKAAQKTLVAFMRAHLTGEVDYQSFLDGESVDPRLTWESKAP